MAAQWLIVDAATIRTFLAPWAEREFDHPTRPLGLVTSQRNGTLSEWDLAGGRTAAAPTRTWEAHSFFGCPSEVWAVNYHPTSGQIFI